MLATYDRTGDGSTIGCNAMRVTIHTIGKPFLTRFRLRRMERFVREFGLGRSTTVLDVGGNTFNWRISPVRPALTFLNIDPAFIGNGLDPLDGRVVGDGCSLPFRDKSFDVVFCNSLIEHLHTRKRQELLASEIMRVGKRYFVQTPNYWFPIEPHYIAPGVQFLPMTIRSAVSRWLTPWGWLQRPTPTQAARMAAEIRLLSKKEIQRLFPHGTVVAERVFGLTKSWVVLGGERA